jgi:hypothetical protein
MADPKRHQQPSLLEMEDLLHGVRLDLARRPYQVSSSPLLRRRVRCDARELGAHEKMDGFRGYFGIQFAVRAHTEEESSLFPTHHSFLGDEHQV